MTRKDAKVDAKKRRARNIYRTVEVRVWGDAKFMSLSDQAKLLWFRLLTGPETTSLPGVLTQALPPALSAALPEVLAMGLAEAAPDCDLIWLPNAARLNPPTSPNHVRAWRTPWELTPECELKGKIYQSLRSLCQGLGEPYLKPFLEGCRQPFAIQDSGFRTQDSGLRNKQTNKQTNVVLSDSLPTQSGFFEAEKPPQGGPPSPDGESLSSRVRDVFEFWDQTCAERLGGRKRKLSDDRATKVRARLNEGYTVEDLKDAVRGNFASKFHAANRHHDLTLICRSAAKVDFFLDKFHHPDVVTLEPSEDAIAVFNRFESLAKRAGVEHVVADDRSREVIEARLAEGIAAKDLCLGLLGASQDQFVREHGLFSLTYVLRDAASVERFLRAGRKVESAELEREWARMKREELEGGTVFDLRDRIEAGVAG